MSSRAPAAPLAERTLHLADEAATVVFGAALGGAATPPLTVFLEGDLGAGKTALVRAVLRARGISGPVPSPTYTLVETYTDRTGCSVQHFDLYRLADPEELELIGTRDYFAESAIRFIEWPERGLGCLETPDLRIALRARGSTRALQVYAVTARGQAVMRAVQWSRLGEKSEI